MINHVYKPSSSTSYHHMLVVTRANLGTGYVWMNGVTCHHKWLSAGTGWLNPLFGCELLDFDGNWLEENHFVLDIPLISVHHTIDYNIQVTRQLIDPFPKPGDQSRFSWHYDLGFQPTISPSFTIPFWPCFVPSETTIITDVVQWLYIPWIHSIFRWCPVLMVGKLLVAPWPWKTGRTPIAPNQPFPIQTLVTPIAAHQCPWISVHLNEHPSNSQVPIMPIIFPSIFPRNFHEFPAKNPSLSGRRATEAHVAVLRQQRHARIEAVHDLPGFIQGGAP